MPPVRWVAPFFHLSASGCVPCGSLGVNTLSRKDNVAYLEFYNWESNVDTSDLPKSVHDLIDAGYEIVVNNDTYVICAQIFTDVNGKLVGVKIMPIKGVKCSLIVDSIEEQLAILYDALGEAAATLEEGTQHTNRLFCQTACGLSMGGDPSVHKPLHTFVEHPDIRIFTAHMGKAFKFWFPERFKMCSTLGQDLKEALGDNFQPPYPNIPFFIDTANTSKQTYFCRVCGPERGLTHMDFKNTLFSMCVIAVFGKFYHKKNTMLVLKELKLLVQLKHVFAPEDAHNVEKTYPVLFWDYMFSHLTLQELKSYHCVA
ncbi:hypothetical protein EXIGLDRAFT_705025 [Exidia glandulosa HHB12029]|uniref:Uncharacterized protein n=1 Tax=Exidia glandulosa HHB12029 TaxID=1314781 RepID=A0A165BG75_EXIGL|nr:hypothetical protein EXIGLDRAFT_705025 [Exidia glandulosa HHB12029]